MFEIKFRNLRDPNFHSAVQVIGGSRGYSSTRSAYKVSKLLKDIGAESDICERLFLEKVQSFGAEIANNKFQIPDDRVFEWTKAIDEFLDTPVTLHHDKLSLSDLEKINLSPLDISAFEPVIDFG